MEFSDMERTMSQDKLLRSIWKALKRVFGLYSLIHARHLLTEATIRWGKAWGVTFPIRGRIKSCNAVGGFGRCHKYRFMSSHTCMFDWWQTKKSDTAPQHVVWRYRAATSLHGLSVATVFEIASRYVAAITLPSITIISVLSVAVIKPQIIQRHRLWRDCLLEYMT